MEKDKALCFLREANVYPILERLPNYVRITGSYARGDENGDSDMDFYVPERKWDEFKRWVYDFLGEPDGSCVTGHISYRVPDLIEFSTVFKRQTGIPKTRTIGELTFKTH